MAKEVTMDKVMQSTLLVQLAIGQMAVAAVITYVITGLIGNTTGVKNFRAGLVMACVFGNSTGLSMALLPTICETAPIFAADPKFWNIGLVYTLMYSATNRLGMFTSGILCLGPDEKENKGHPAKSKSSQIIAALCNESNLACVVGMTIALTPLRQVFMGGPLSFVFEATEFVGRGYNTMLCLVLGMQLDSQIDTRGAPPKELDVVSMVVISILRLVILPLATILFVVTFKGTLLPADDPMMSFTLMLQAAVPAATSLNLICQNHWSKASVPCMSALLFWQTIASVGTMSVILALSLYVL